MSKVNLPKILHYNLPDSGNIYTAAELEMFTDVHNYEKTIKLQCEQLLLEAQAEAEEIKQKAKEEAIAEVKEEQEKLLAQFEDKLTTAFSEINQDIYPLIARLLHKFGFFSLEPQMIKQLIDEELAHHKLRTEDIVLYANAKTIDKVSELFMEHKPKFKINNNLLDNECVFESNLHLFKLDIDSAVAKINSLINNE